MNENGHRLVRPALAFALLTAATGLWLSGSQISRADTATQNQGVSASVQSTISWGSAGPCNQSMPAHHFGTLSAGESTQSPTFTGCVTSNARWEVDAIMTAEPTNSSESATLPAQNFVAQVTSRPPGSSTDCSDTTSCTLDRSRTLVGGAPRPQREFQYNYTLNVPDNASGGDYTGGNVQFTASN